MNKVKSAVIGAGFFGQKHARVYDQLSASELLGVCDLDYGKAQKLASELNCEAYQRAEEVFGNPEIDVVNICVPDDSHRRPFLDALKADKHVLIEKPLADTLADARELLQASRGYQKKTMVGHLVRFDPRSIKARETISRGEIGDIIHVISRRNSPRTGAQHYAEHCELLTHSGVHDLDLIRWLVDSEYASVYAKDRSGFLAAEGLEVRDSVLALFQFESGVIYNFENSWVLPENFPSILDAKVEIVGSEGSLTIDVFQQGLDFYSSAGVQHPDLYHWPELEGQVEGAIRREIDHFVNCVLNDEKPHCSIEEGYRAVEAAVRTQQALSEGCEISF
ncbi:MAG: Gfo/Idh/MocA family protein [Candidatus Acetothermia bacterium]